MEVIISQPSQCRFTIQIDSTFTESFHRYDNVVCKKHNLGLIHQFLKKLFMSQFHINNA
jgi:uncharacterized membrane protein